MANQDSDFVALYTLSTCKDLILTYVPAVADLGPTIKAEGCRCVALLQNYINHFSVPAQRPEQLKHL